MRKKGREGRVYGRPFESFIEMAGVPSLRVQIQAPTLILTCPGLEGRSDLVCLDQRLGRSRSLLVGSFVPRLRPVDF